ncbi:hypothetical protein ABFS82_04G019800 [Erythranthe guttata]|uniref:uncharacterized protein OsI_027940 isoform X2 n=1 Tax=Erythranthe guttata TaxID=4155 RepID=UPI00064DA2AD|nr:PREDICTED: uncharacterized protein OsI_027940 isoform X2 [Erythranthe guttata]|eukprot:XP_012833079.1 PREDICTED: uncharacterized protein OsI_027940 isoform X2 [Erythranthe guttata]
MMSRHPEVKWDEREDRVYLKPDVKNHKVNVDPNGTFTFSGSGGTDNNLYEIKLDLLEKVDVEESNVNIVILCFGENGNKLLRGYYGNYNSRLSNLLSRCFEI